MIIKRIIIVIALIFWVAYNLKAAQYIWASGSIAGGAVFLVLHAIIDTMFYNAIKRN